MGSHPVQQIKGVGDKVASYLEEMNIYTVEDLLHYFPYRYNFHEIKPLGELIHQDQVTIQGTIIHDPILTFYRKGKSRLSFMIEVENVAIKGVMFNRAFAKKQFKQGNTFTLTGKWDAHRLQITVSHYESGEMNKDTNIQAIYSIRGDLSHFQLKKVISHALTQFIHEEKDFLPKEYLKAYQLPTREKAIQTMHQPESRIALKHARRRFIYEEFLLFQLKMQLLRKIAREASEGNVQYFDQLKVEKFIKKLPFSLTNAQERSLHEILTDMRSPYRMNRLLQGDVGSGKTAVAAICLYASITSGKQGALMVPTEILAEQHFQSLVDLFGEQAKIALLTGSVKGKKRQEINQAIANHDIDIVIGTHALIQNDVLFADLGFVIVDEQHRFGVNQRRKLRDKGLHPDVLFMTATPIPRTLAITVFGDMDVSIIDEMPAGRKPIETYWTKENTFERVLTFMQKRISSGEQAYFVCPLIEESDKLDIQNAVDLHRQLQSFYPPEIKIGLMHGRLSADEKEQIMTDFSNQKIQILVSTTVVEVGVNVPNATVMVIYDAQRFGLSQLHQLRGRVGRGDKQSYCILIADPKGETGKERMKIMTETNDGFKLSEHDLNLRGAGDLFGEKQSGLPEFKVADVIHDYRALEVARNDAVKIVEGNLLEKHEEFHPLKKYIEENSFLHEKLD